MLLQETLKGFTAGILEKPFFSPLCVSPTAKSLLEGARRTVNTLCDLLLDSFVHQVCSLQMLCASIRRIRSHAQPCERTSTRASAAATAHIAPDVLTQPFRRTNERTNERTSRGRRKSAVITAWAWARRRMTTTTAKPRMYAIRRCAPSPRWVGAATQKEQAFEKAGGPLRPLSAGHGRTTRPPSSPLATATFPSPLKPRLPPTHPP